MVRDHLGTLKNLIGVDMKKAIVTGVSSGVGNLVVKTLSENGYFVIGTSRNPDQIKNLNKDNVILEKLDLSQETSIDLFYNKYKNETIDLIINNTSSAGLHGAQMLSKETHDNFMHSYMVNVAGPMYMSRLFIPNLKKSNNATLVFISSFARKHFYAGGGNYSASKLSIYAIAKLFRLELSPFKIKVTEICPAAINTHQYNEGALEAEDIANTVLWIGELPQRCNIDLIEISPSIAAQG
jgi:NADP-dependent 3-hydroxy acid dehydrogenase YdfG